MQAQPTHFFSDGLKLDATWYEPDVGSPPDRPIVVPCSGFTGLRDIHPARFARALTAAGYTCFGFDYRGFGLSEGTPGRVRLEEQVEDIISAAHFVHGDATRGHRPIVLLGWGMAGGLMVAAADQVPELAGLIGCNGLYDPPAVQHAHRTPEAYAAFQQRLAEAHEAASYGQAPCLNPFDVYPLDEVSRGYVDGVLRRTDGYGLNCVDPGFADSLLHFHPRAHVAGLTGVPLLMVHGLANRLHPLDQAEAFYAEYPGPKHWHGLEGAGHTEFMLDDHPIFQDMARRVARWLDGLCVQAAS